MRDNRRNTTGWIKKSLGLLASLPASTLSNTAPLPSTGSSSETNTDTTILFAQGVTIQGVSAGDYSGYSLASVDDVNDDGIADFVIGAPYTAPPGKFRAGTVYLIWGKNDSSWSSVFELSDLGTNGVVINGNFSSANCGYSVASADVNNDGIPDLLMGAPLAAPGGRSSAGVTYIVWGKNDTWPLTLELSALGTNGVAIHGALSRDESGYSVASAGDVNGDGIPDLVIGAPYASPGDRSFAGVTYVLWGKNGTWPLTIELSALDETIGCIINGALAGDYSGWSVASVDLNGDGIADLVTGAYLADLPGGSGAGIAYVVWGKNGTWPLFLELSTLGTKGVAINGVGQAYYTGWSVASIDLNGDGISDLAIGAYRATPGGRSIAGITYVVWGKKGTWSPVIELSILGTQGVAINGALANDGSGSSVAASDVNDDGIPDLVIGARLASPGDQLNAGMAYVIFGKKGTWQTSLELADLDETTGFALKGVSEQDGTGWSAASARDVNSDGIDDFLVGAPVGSSLSSGFTYLVFGCRTFYPTLTNQLTIGQGEKVSLTPANLNLSNQTISVTYLASNISHGQFESTLAPGTPITLFTSDAIANDQIYFVHDNSTEAPSYRIVPQGSALLTLSSLPAAINFTYVAPTTPAPTTTPTTAIPTSAAPTTAAPTTAAPTTAAPTTAAPTTAAPTTAAPTSAAPTTAAPTSAAPTSAAPTSAAPTTAAPTSAAPTSVPTTPAPTSETPTAVPTIFIPRSSSQIALIIVLSIISAVIIALFLLHYRNQKKMRRAVTTLALEMEGSSANQINGALSLLAEQLFNQIKTTGLFGYRNDEMTRGYLQGLQLLLAKLKEQGMDPTAMDPAQRDLLLKQIINAIKNQLVTQKNPGRQFLSFYTPYFSPTDLIREAPNIAASLVSSLFSVTTDDQTKINFSAFPLLHYLKMEMDLIDDFNSLKGLEYLQTFSLLIQAFSKKNVNILNMTEPQLQLFATKLSDVLKKYLKEPEDTITPNIAGSSRDPMREPLLSLNAEKTDQSNSLDLEKVKRHLSTIVNATLKKHEPNAAPSVPAAASHSAIVT